MATRYPVKNDFVTLETANFVHSYVIVCCVTGYGIVERYIIWFFLPGVLRNGSFCIG